ncbi:MAG: DUF2807 domain-containing protein, partial [Eudoraea sp.]|nr:DUF2807 domain-containing protein [Eudoraea sp.]
MKRVILLTALLISTMSFSQRIVDKEVGEFDEIKVYDL